MESSALDGSACTALRYHGRTCGRVRASFGTSPYSGRGRGLAAGGCVAEFLGL